MSDADEAPQDIAARNEAPPAPAESTGEATSDDQEIAADPQADSLEATTDKERADDADETDNGDGTDNGDDSDNADDDEDGDDSDAGDANHKKGSQETSRNDRQGQGGKRRDSRRGLPREPNGPTAICRYGRMRHTGEFRYGKLKEPLKPGLKVVIRTDRGVELGQVMADVCRDPEAACDACTLRGEQVQTFLENEGGDYPFRRNGRMLRIANEQDLIEHRHLEGSAKEAGTYCREQIRELRLDMRLVTVEHLLGGERIIFYFTAEQRVDFRELVRRLAGQYRTRIEMRQVGARDEARLVGDYERCGQRCCCQQFLKNLKPVSMRMAKVQKATLDPSKISGRCGRLMCCLRYEDDGYNELRKNLPHRNTWVRTDDTIGRVIDSQIITQLVKIIQPDGNIVAVRVDDLVERNCQPPGEDARQQATDRHRKQQIAEATKKVDGVEVPQKDAQQADAGKRSSGGESKQGGETSSKRKGRRRGRRRRGRGKGKASAEGGGQQNAGGGNKSSSRRRRKPRNKGNASGGGGKGNSGGS